MVSKLEGSVERLVPDKTTTLLGKWKDPACGGTWELKMFGSLSWCELEARTS